MIVIMMALHKLLIRKQGHICWNWDLGKVYQTNWRNSKVTLVWSALTPEKSQVRIEGGGGVCRLGGEGGGWESGGGEGGGGVGGEDWRGDQVSGGGRHYGDEGAHQQSSSPKYSFCNYLQLTVIYRASALIMIFLNIRMHAGMRRLEVLGLAKIVFWPMSIYAKAFMTT